METTHSTTDQPTMPRHTFFRLLGTGIGALLFTQGMAGCAREGATDPGPDKNSTIDFTVRLDDQANENLKSKGGYVVVNDIIIAQTKDGNFVAVSARCTNEGTKLVFRPNDNQFYCPLCLSRFDIDGKVVANPATLPLIKYNAVANAASGVVRVFN